MHYLLRLTKMFLRAGIPTLIIASLLGFGTPSIALASALPQPVGTDFSCTTFNIPAGSIHGSAGQAKSNDGYLSLAGGEDKQARKKCEELFKALVQGANRLRELNQKRNKCADPPPECSNDQLKQINEAIRKERLKFENNLARYRQCRERYPNLPEAPSLP